MPKLCQKNTTIKHVEALGSTLDDPETLLNKHRQIAESFEAKLAKEAVLMRILIIWQMLICLYRII